MRPKATVFIGNGFTISLSHQLNFTDWHETSKILPPPNWMQIPENEDIGSGGPIWTSQEFPELWELEKRLSKANNGNSVNFYQLCEEVLKQGKTLKINHGSKEYSFSTDDVGYQIRKYLWEYFYRLEERFSSEIQEDSGFEQYFSSEAKKLSYNLYKKTASWKLIYALKEMSQAWDLTLVSYNYDKYLESILEAHGCQLVYQNPYDENELEELLIDKIRVLHIHGTLATQMNPTERNTQQTEFTGNLDDQRQLKLFFPSRRPAPEFPDLVPPGHSEEHLVSKFSNFRGFIQKLIERSDVIGSIGFSGASPDDTELKAILSFARNSVKTFCIGLEDELKKTISYQELSKLNGDGHVAFDISKVDDFLQWSKNQFADYFSPEGIEENLPNLNFGELFIVIMHLIGQGDFDTTRRLVNILEGDDNLGGNRLLTIRNYIEAELYRQGGNPQMAQQHYLQALDMIDEEERRAAVHIKLKICDCYHKLVMTDESQPILNSIEGLIREFTNSKEESEFFYCKADSAILKGDLRTALTYFKKNFDSNINRKDWLNAALSSMRISTCLYHQQAFEDAITWLDRAMELYILERNNKGIGMVLSTRAHYMSDHNHNLELAEEFCQQAIDVLRDSLDELVKAKFIYAKVLKASNRIEEALIQINEVIEICSESNFDLILRVALEFQQELNA
ncbi:hypothetical protein [Marinoscillum sp.]|uniref:hypothetical protein n=1 Tax=Marinoscillum sp. TaxID=2024838 RepID=UPI003BACCA1D